MYSPTTVRPLPVRLHSIHLTPSTFPGQPKRLISLQLVSSLCRVAALQLTGLLICASWQVYEGWGEVLMFPEGLNCSLEAKTRLALRLTSSCCCVWLSFMWAGPPLWCLLTIKERKVGSAAEMCFLPSVLFLSLSWRARTHTRTHTWHCQGNVCGWAFEGADSLLCFFVSSEDVSVKQMANVSGFCFLSLLSSTSC